MLQAVTTAKQSLFAPHVNWSVSDLPKDYTDKLLPYIFEFSIEPEDFFVSKLMVLQHLAAEHRMSVLSRLEGLDTPSARSAVQLFRMFL